MPEKFTAPIPDNDLARVATLHQYAMLDTPQEQAYDDVTALASYICGTPFSTITLVDRDRQWFKSELGFGTRQTGREDGFCACAMLSPETLIISDTLLDPRFAHNPFVTGRPELRFYAGAPLVAPNGHILGTVCVFDTRPRELSPEQIGALEALSRQVMRQFDSRLKALETERAAASLMQTEKLAAVGRLASTMAHGINNPLEAVTNLIYLSRQHAIHPDVKIWLGMAEEELRRVSTIANLSLQFHKQSSYPETITCLDLFTATLEVYESRLRNSCIVVNKRKRALEPVECYASDIRQVLGNVITNSIDAMPIGGTLFLRSRRGTDWRTGRAGIILTVADTGIGMNPDTLRRASEAFFSTKDIGGTGLGLWICSDIMQRHDGRIKIKSHSGRGTTVSLFLPL